jgi:hypothetical protein
VEITLPQNKGVIGATEFRHKSTRAVFKTEIYMVLKLAMGLLGSGNILEDSRKVYHILTESP